LPDQAGGLVVGDMEFRIAGDADASGSWTRGALPKGTVRQCAPPLTPFLSTLYTSGSLETALCLG
jgi:hypothetical protein